MKPSKSSTFAYELGLNLRQSRRKRRVQSGHLAAKLGIHRNTLSRWEHAEAEISLWDFLQYCAALDVSPTHLLPGWTMRAGMLAGQVERENQAKKSVKAQRDPLLTAHEKTIYGVRNGTQA